ncbi:3-phosphoshikimate 1-carboxyvinyltransferase [Candidatus Formimonas warabiya]|uniref:3-phosphoshikimate 1-carboxyvinyltransferase n=2 Tax=Formimonas warabiya TaxID=1761012 RepID=A0A3G1KNQ8_FORW1|nr:3-phosphoshikimate 1-carboxyvinyltransferase [Candidatus Formimonas warabiya]ATW24103.1 3-phosphoshikimate 1-carboxyvinyltransferase [Candidatus Formimonas warabiya]
MNEVIKGISGKIQGTLSVPGDKSISHRAVLLGSIAEGRTEIEGFLMGEDCLSTVACVRKLGIEVETLAPGQLHVFGKGLFGWQEPREILDAGNSGTTMRLMLGLLAGHPFHAVMKGDASLSSRPMARVVDPLRAMGARIDGRNEGKNAPLSIRGGNLHPITYSSPVSSAQVKSAVLLAGLFTEGETTVIEPAKSRDHTETMLASFGAQVKTTGCISTVKGLPRLKGEKIMVPGDISSAAFFLVAAAITPGSELMLKNIGVNPSRTGIIDVLKRMGAQITCQNERIEAGEPVADIQVKHSHLQGITVEGDDIPRLIDEIPVLAVAAAHATGTTVIKDAGELRVKETDRIISVVSQMAALGMDIEPREDGMVIRGGRTLKGTAVNSFHDHRIAMALAVAGISAAGVTTIENAESVKISFPGFFEMLKSF